MRIQSPTFTPAVDDTGISLAPRVTLAVTVPITAPGSLLLTVRKPPLKDQLVPPTPTSVSGRGK